ncbi:MAG: hypothetical protein M1823_006172 [Watsoniomyces obsoletus]|nr:MAG: hypothetical protein M1823_006172 [Watsoniomyces obsoletus]
MAKEKSVKVGNVPHKALSARISYLYQAAAYLQRVPTTTSRQPHQFTSLSPPNDKESWKLVKEDIHSRAAVTEGPSIEASKGSVDPRSPVKRNNTWTKPLARQLLSHLREVSLKSQIRLTPNIKRSICQRCHTLLSPGQTSELVIENLSRHAHQSDLLLAPQVPWPDETPLRLPSLPIDRLRWLASTLHRRSKTEEGPQHVQDLATNPNYRPSRLRRLLLWLGSHLRRYVSWARLDVVFGYTCVLSGPPGCSRKVICYVLKFDDGTKWYLRIPARPEDFDQWASRLWTQEAMSTQFIARMTTIPVPRIHAFSASFDNPLGYPFILSDFLEGERVMDIWGPGGSDPARREFRRLRVLDGVARAMIQLDRFRFGRSGCLEFDHEGRVLGVGPTIVEDTSVWEDAAERNETRPQTTPFYELNPCDDVTDYLTQGMNGAREKDPRPEIWGGKLFAYLLLSWVGEEDHARCTDPFVLTYPGLHELNVFVDEEGDVTGIIGWKELPVEPLCVGNRAFPYWLTRDWDPSFYNPEPNEDRWGDPSPEAMERYRRMYMGLLESYGSRAPDVRLPSASTGPGIRTTWSQLTKRSTLVLNLLAAPQSLLGPMSVMFKVVDEINKLTTVADGTQTEDVPPPLPIYLDATSECSDSTAESDQQADAESLNGADVAQTPMGIGTDGLGLPTGAVEVPEMTGEGVDHQGDGPTGVISLDNAAESPLADMVTAGSSTLVGGGDDDDTSSNDEYFDATEDERGSDGETGHSHNDEEEKSDASTTSDDAEVHGDGVDDSVTSDGSDGSEEDFDNHLHRFDLYDLCQEFAEGRVDDATIRRLWRGFNRLCV